MGGSSFFVLTPQDMERVVALPAVADANNDILYKRTTDDTLWVLNEAGTSFLQIKFTAGATDWQHFATLAELRGSTDHDSTDWATVEEGTAIYEYDATDVSADDGNWVIKPNDVVGAGRWMKRPTLTGLGISATAAELNAVNDGVSVNVTAANLNILTGSGETALHKHALTSLGIDATAAEINAVNDGVSANVTAVNLSALTGGGETALHIHDDRYYTETEVDALLDGTTKVFSKKLVLFQPENVQAVIDAVPVFCVETEEFPDGITIEKVYVKTWGKDAGDALSVNIEEWTSPTDGAPATVVGVTLGAGVDENSGTPAGNAGDIATGSIVMVDLDTVSVNALLVHIIYSLQ